MRLLLLVFVASVLVLVWTAWSIAKAVRRGGMPVRRAASRKAMPNDEGKNGQADS